MFYPELLRQHSPKVVATRGWLPSQVDMEMIEQHIPPEDLGPVNGTDDAKVQTIADRMLENGWDGPHLLVEEADGFLFAWTGSHRIAAAARAGLPTIPCMVLSQREMDSAFVPAYTSRYSFSSWRSMLTSTLGPYDEHRLRGLEGVGLEAAATLLREEIARMKGETGR